MLIEEPEYKTPGDTAERLLEQFKKEMGYKRINLSELESWLIVYIHNLEINFTLKSK